MSTNNTNTSGRSGAGIGSKIRGAAEVVHGVGDNIRGTFLGAIDTTAGHQSENDEIAARGRMEVSQGMAKIRGAGAEAAAGYESGGGFGTGTGATRPSGSYEDKTSTGAGTQTQPGYQQEEVQPGSGYRQDKSGNEYDKGQSGSNYQQGDESQVDRKQ